MIFSKILLHKGSIAVVMAVMFVIPAKLVSAASTISVGTDFDIPISKLNEVKKKAPAKRVKHEFKKKNKSSTESPKAVIETTLADEPAFSVQTQNLPVESNNDIRNTSVQQKSTVAVEPLPEPGSEKTRIVHSPYSFVVTGRRTVIQAVIDSKTDIQEVNCILRGIEGGMMTMVKMHKLIGTQFTYTATLPGLSPNSASLSYTIDSVDSQGRMTRSKEFVTPVKSSPVVPNWQLEGSE